MTKAIDESNERPAQEYRAGLSNVVVRLRVDTHQDVISKLSMNKEKDIRKIIT